MARPLRLELAGGWYHVTGRGNERRKVFRDDGDRTRFLNLLGGIEARYGVEVHGYVLMDNHYHLVVRLSREVGLSAAMHWLLVSYTGWFNRRHRRSGHLFQGRFKAMLVEFEQWGVSVSRYVHLNPVRVRRLGLDKRARAADRRGLGEAPTREVIRDRLKVLRQYRWSSYRQYVGLTGKDAWLHLDEVSLRFGRGVKGKQAYRQYVEEAIRGGRQESPWDELTAGFLLGGEEWIEKVGKLLKGNPQEQSGLKRLRGTVGLEAIVEAIAKEKGEAWADFVNRKGDWGRDAALLLARRRTSLTNREIAEWVGGLDDSAVAQAVRRIQIKIATNQSLRSIIERLEGRMSFVKT